MLVLLIWILFKKREDKSIHLIFASVFIDCEKYVQYNENSLCSLVALTHRIWCLNSGPRCNDIHSEIGLGLSIVEEIR